MYLVVILAQKHFVNMCSILPTNLGKQYTFYCHCCQLMISMGNGWWATDNVGTGRWATGEVIYVKHFHSLNSCLVKIPFIIPQYPDIINKLSNRYYQTIRQQWSSRCSSASVVLSHLACVRFGSFVVLIAFSVQKEIAQMHFLTFVLLIPTNHEQSIF